MLYASSYNDANLSHSKKISKALAEEYENTINVAYEHAVFRVPLSYPGKQFVDELIKLTDYWVSDSPSTTALKSLMLQRTFKRMCSSIEKAGNWQLKQ